MMANMLKPIHQNNKFFFLNAVLLIFLQRQNAIILRYYKTNIFIYIFYTFQYGLYSSLCGGFVYAILGTIPELNIAPTALLSLLTFQYAHQVSFGIVRAAVMLTFFAGVIELLCGIFHLGKKHFTL